MKNTFGHIKIQYPLTNSETQKLPFYVLHVGSMEFQHPCYRPNGLTDYQFLFCTSGRGHLVVSGESYTLTAGMGVFFRPFVPHEYYAEQDPWTTHWVLFNGTAVDMVPSIQHMGQSHVFHVVAPEKLALLHNKIYASAEIGGLLNITDISLNLYEFLLESDSCIGNTPVSKHGLREKQLLDVIAYIEANYQKDISLETLAAIAGITPQHLCRLFKTTYHMRPMEYLTNYRMKHAKFLLMTQKELTLKEIASSVGFRDVSYFCYIFKKSEGITPSEFKNLN